MSAFETIEARLQLSSDGFQSAIGNAVNSLGSLENKAGGAHKAMGALGVGMAAVAAGGIAKSVGASMDLQSALTESQAIMGDLTQGEMKQMEDAAREVGKTTTFSAEEAGDAFYYLASAGMDAEQSVASMGDVAQFAQAGAFDLATATDLATDAQSALGMSSEDAAENAENLNQVMDVLVKSNTLANASVEEFSQSLTNKAAAAMRQAGIEIEEGASALAVFADQGLKGNRAGTILARTIEGLQSAAQENAGAFEELGVAVYDSEGNMRPMADIVEDMDKAMAGMSTEQKNAAMEQLGLNERAAQGIKLMSGNADQMREYEGELQNAGGTAEEVADNQLKSLSAQWDILKSQITDVGIGIGNNLLPGLTRLMSVVSDAVGAFVKVNDATDGWLGTIALIGTLVTGLAMAAGSLSAVIGAGGLATAVTAASGAVGGLATAFAILTGPIGLVIGAVALLGAAWATNFGGIREHTQRVVDVFMDEFGPAITWLKGVASDLATALGGGGGGGLSASFASVGEAVKPLIPLIADTLIWAIRGLADVTRATIQAAKQAWVTLEPIVRGVVQGIVTLLDILYVTGRGIFEVATNIWKGNWQEAWLGIFNIFADVAGRIIGFLSDTFMPGLDDAMAGKLGEMRDRWVKWGMDIYQTVITRFQQVKGAIIAALASIQAVAEPYINYLRVIWMQFSRQILMEARITWKAIKAAIAPTLNWLRASIPPVLAFLGQKWQQFKAGVVPIVRALASIVRTVLGAMMSFAKTVISAGLTVIRAYWSTWGSDITAVVRMLATTAMTIIGQLMNTIKTVIIVALRLIRGDWQGAWNAIETYVRSTAARIRSLLTGWATVLTGIVRTLVSEIIGFFRDLYHRLVGGSIIPNLVNRTISLFTNLASRVREIVSEWVSTIVGFVTDLRDRAILQARVLKHRFVTEMTRLAAQAEQRVKDMVDDLVRRVRDGISRFKTAGKDLIGAFASGIRDAVGRATRAIKSVVSDVREYLPGSDAKRGPLSDVTDSGYALVDSWADEIESGAGRAAKAAGSVAEAVKSSLMQAEDGSMVPEGFYSGGSAPSPENTSVYDAISEKHGETSPDAIREMLERLSHTQRQELADAVASTKWMEKDYRAMAAMRKSQGGKLSQGLYDALITKGAGATKLRELLGEGTRDDGPMVRAEDGSLVPKSFYAQDAGGARPQSAAPQSATPQDSGGTEVKLDFSGIPDDAYISVEAFKEMAAEEIEKKQHQDIKKATNGTFSP